MEKLIKELRKAENKAVELGKIELAREIRDLIRKIIKEEV